MAHLGMRAISKLYEPSNFMTNITSEQFRKTLSLLPSGVSIMTVSPPNGQDRGVTISSLTSLSLHPPQVLFCLSQTSSIMADVEAASHFAISILGDTQTNLANAFTRPGLVQWQEIQTHRHPLTNCLLLAGALGHIICERGPLYAGGDHKIILGTVIDVEINSPLAPLLRHRGNYLTTRALAEE